MFDDDVFQLKEPSTVCWLSYFFAVSVLIKHYSVTLIELECAWREHNDYVAKGACHNMVACFCVCGTNVPFQNSFDLLSHLCHARV